MKRFQDENGKKIVFVQGKDLRFLDAQSRTPSSVKKMINFNSININKQEEYYEFTNEEFIDFLKNEAFYILDVDEFDKKTNEDISKEFDRITNNIEKIQKEKKKLKKQKIEQKGFDEALYALLHYQSGIVNYIEEKRKANKQRL